MQDGKEGTMKITLLLDNLNSWMFPYAKTLLLKVRELGHKAVLIHDADKIKRGDLAFFLSCEKIIPKSIRDRNAHNLVVHESDLPKGKGWSPLTWQILEGKNEIPITLFEAEDAVDSGDIYFQDMTHFGGSELVDELRRVQGEITIELALKFIEQYPNIRGKKQDGKETFYPRRRPEDSELNPNLSLVKLFNQLRVADNERYPAFFKHRGKKYFLRIWKAEE
ncbi:MAG: formyltransferase family protein [Candidatus Paceibacterota bacterium]|jgi:methionyl-tRNA formyltransferase